MTNREPGTARAPAGPVQHPKTLFRQALTYGTFPFIFGGGMALGFWAILRGWEPPPVLRSLGVDGIALTVGSISVAAVFLIALLERIHPYIADYNVAKNDVRTDTLHLLVSVILAPEAWRALSHTGLYMAAAYLTTKVGSGIWPTELPLFLQLVLLMLTAEFFEYWAHRLMHEVPLFWRFHATHHSAERLYWLNAARFHPIDQMVTIIVQTSIPILLGCPVELIGLFFLHANLHGMLQHCNIDIRLGPLNWIFSMAELHRWHHSRTIEESNTNYGGNLIFWDIVFGTRLLPSDRLPPEEIGIADSFEFPTGYVDQLLSPFRWSQLVSAGPSSDARSQSNDAAAPAE